MIMKKYINGSAPTSVLPSPGAKRSEAERSETERRINPPQKSESVPSDSEKKAQ
jgi:hypothetical protein